MLGRGIFIFLVLSLIMHQLCYLRERAVFLKDVRPYRLEAMYVEY